MAKRRFFTGLVLPLMGALAVAVARRLMEGAPATATGGVRAKQGPTFEDYRRAAERGCGRDADAPLGSRGARVADTVGPSPQ
jgi:hypothetical protein